MKIITDVPPVFPDKTYVALDSEWFNLKSTAIHRPTSGSFGCMTLCADGENVYFLDTPEKATAAIANIQNCAWWIQEAKFDLTQLSRFVPWTLIHHPKLIDTLLMERIVHAGYYDRFALNDLARRYLGVYLEKELQKSFQGDSMSQEQVEYACKDAQILWQVGQAQKSKIKRDDFYIWQNIDLPMIWATMNFQGFRLDVDRWLALSKFNKAEQEKIDATLPFNAQSPQQVLDYLRKTGFKGLENTLEDNLEKAIKKYSDTEAAKIAALVLQSRSYGKAASTYGESWIENYVEWETDEVGTIFADYHITGAETGRMSCSDPNMQNIPIRETKVYRECFIPRPGRVLLVGDFSQQEIGIAAFVSDDKLMISMFNTGEDVYILAAKELLGQTIDKNNPLRKRMKSVVLGIDYGLSEYGLARKENITLEEAKELIKKFNRRFPRMYEYQKEQSKQTYQTKTVLGRRCYLNPYSYQCGNNALNNPIQGTAADMMKAAVGQMYSRWPFPYMFNLVGVIHDEAAADCPKDAAQDQAKFMQEEMESVANWMCPGMKFRAEVKICPNSWAEKE